jgi:hypothetical protein
MVTIPKSICRLAGIKEGSLISWELSKYERNVFVMRILESDNNNNNNNNNIDTEGDSV